MLESGRQECLPHSNTGARQPRGVAILLVLAVIAGLMALAAPFVFSMLLQGRAAKNEVYSLQARAGAEAAIAHSLAQLYKTLPVDKDSRPDVVTPRDLKIEMNFPGAAAAFNKAGLSGEYQSSSGLMWSARVEDEQGKINLNTAPPALIGNLMGSALLTESAEKGASSLLVDQPQRFPKNGGTISLIGEPFPIPYSRVQGNEIVLNGALSTPHIEGALVFDGRARLIADNKFKAGGASFIPFRSVYEIKAALGANVRDALAPDEFARMERHITLTSGVGGPWWGQAERPVQQMGVQIGGFDVEKGDGFAPGTLVRRVVNGAAQQYARVRSVTQKNQGGAHVRLEVPIDVAPPPPGLSSYIQPELKHPININTATTEVLEACVMGICIASGKEAINRQKAELLVQHLLSGNTVYTDAASLKKSLDRAHEKGLLSAQQRDAVYINATEPNSAKLRTSTVPFCFTSYGSYTIEGTGVVNSENGLQFCRHIDRQLVTLPSPWPGRFLIEHQSGFQSLVDQGLSSRVTTFPIPMGITRYKKNAPSVKLPSPSTGGARLDVGQSEKHGNVQDEWIEHCEDEKDPGYRQDGYDIGKRGPFIVPERGQGQNGRPLPGRRGNNNNNNNTNGVATAPTAVEMWFKPKSVGQCVFYEQGIDEDRNRVTFSYEASKGLMVTICDAGLEGTDVSSGDWQHLKRPPIQYIYPVQLEAGEWYHVAASWKTGLHNGQEIRLDAQPIPPRGEQTVYKPGSKLGSDISIEEVNSIELDEAENEQFPKAGAVKIGEEIIEYAQRSGNTLQGLRRGARLSAAAKHSSGEFVIPFGYSVNLSQDLPVGGAKLVENVERPNVARTRVQVPQIPGKLLYVLDTETKKLPVDDATNFPPSGFIKVSNELIYYGKKTANSFEQLMRAQRSVAGFPARNISNNADVQLASLQITDIAQYDDRGIVQIDSDDNDKLVEWFYYGSKQSVNGKNYLVALMTGDSSQYYFTGPPTNNQNGTRKDGPGVQFGDSFRQKFGIGKNYSHSKNAKVIPVVAVSGPHCGNQLSPYGEQGVSELSIIERGARDGDVRYVKQAYINQGVSQFDGPDGPTPPCKHSFHGYYFEFYVGLNDFVTRRFPQGNTRFLKWPSGELPDAVGAKRHACADRNGEGKLNGIVDEIKVLSLESQQARIAMTTEGGKLDSGADTITLEEFDFWPKNYNGHIARGTQVHGLELTTWPESGLIRVNDELMFFTTKRNKVIEYYADVYPNLNGKPPRANKAERWVRINCPDREELWPNLQSKQAIELSVQRGVLGTDAVDHSAGSQVLLFDGMAVTALSGALGDQDSFSVLNEAGFPKEGYAIIGNEVVSWIEGRGKSFTGIKNFRGRYGTSQGSHDAGEIVRCLPFRYWDREAKYYDGDGLAYVQTGYAASDAIWDTIEMRIVGTEDQPKPNSVRPRVLVRFDGKPSWDTEPTNAEGGLFEFRNKEGVQPIRGSRRGGARGDQIEMRLYWEFMRGAFYPNSDWKRTFTVEKMRATYSTPLIMRRLDEIEKR